ncbi:ribonuclease Z, mitochondrial-like [Pollicipes pollicipes]|uniref:ribonuclease Z, mitochondrial-like n=1 Tax=Pollicipes pollicipes TaxID=41117 RepID=UPI0018850E13|nr:ribonuclease Z, mitochondrial-like [Pollicipes pollicipes]
MLQVQCQQAICRLLSRHSAAAMPKAVDLTERRDARTAKTKKLKSYGPPSAVKLQVLGTGAEGAPRSLYVFTTSASYLFNCGEGTQRLSHERKTRLARLENVFITTNAWRNVGGVLGALLTLNDIGVPALTLHGPPGLNALYRDTRNFIQLRGMNVSHRSETHADFVDVGLTVRAVPLWGAAASREPPAVAAGPPPVDYFAFERTGGAGGPPLPERAVSYAYVCSVPDRAGRLLLDKCVSLGVQPGPLLGQLKSGRDVVLEDGRVVRSEDVTSPDEVGAQFLVLELPSPDFLPSLSDLNSSLDASRLAAVVHFSPAAVMDSPEYRAWREGLPATVRHVALNETCRGHGSEAVHRLQHQLHTIDPQLFPLLAGDDPTTDQPTDGAPCKRVRLSSEDDPTAEQDQDQEQEQEQEQESSLIHPPSGWGLSLRPPAEPDTEGVTPVTPDVYRAELAADEAFSARLAEYRQASAALPPAAAAGVYPQTVLLGTGSSIPNKKRNTSGILVNLSEEHSVLLDCGEGTHGQLVRLLGQQQAAAVLRRLGAVYISHLHADHHIGLISILEARRRALGAEHRPCLLLAPGPIAGYLTMYHNKMAPLLDTFSLVANARLQLSSSVVYSGDTRPCPELVALGQNCDLLIHEATHEDELQEEAELRAHSTTSEAIGVGRDMAARHVLLTHFSQRYSNLPLLPEPAPENVGVAYDNMVVDYRHLPRLPLLYPCLRQAFAESYDQCVERTAKRRDRKQKLADQLANDGLV